MKSRAMILTGDRTLEPASLAVPDALGDDEAILRVEANGLCGSDWDQYVGMHTKWAPYPVIAGHETVGRLEHVGPRAAARWGLGEGARVAVESAAPCGRCPDCQHGRWRLCRQATIYGFSTLTNEPGLSGGYAEFMVLRPNSVVYSIPEHLSTEDAVMFNPLGAGFDWAVEAAGTKLGETILVLGPGLRGLTSVIAAREAGAANVIVAGRSRRPWKLDLAVQFGATHVVNTDEDSLVDAVREITGGAMADRAVDTTPASMQPTLDAMDALRPEGTLVLAGMKHGEPLPGIDDRVITKALTVRGVAMVSPWGKEQAIRTLASGRYDFSSYHTHTLALDDLDHAMQLVGGQVEGERSLHITVVP